MGERLRAQSHRIVAHLEEKVAELSQANERLLELDRARKEFYRNISHELATPMTPIVGYLKLLGRRRARPDEHRADQGPARHGRLRRRLRALIDNLLDVSGLETGSMRFLHRDYDFLDTTRRAVARMRRRFAEQRVTLVEELPRGPLPGWGDAERLSRAMMQLLENAAKFTPQGGYVGVRVSTLAQGHTSSASLTPARGSPPIAPAGSSSRFTRSTARPPVAWRRRGGPRHRAAHRARAGG